MRVCSVRLLLACAVAVLSSRAAPALTLPPEATAYSANATFDIGGQRYGSTVIADHGRERRVVQTPYGPQTIIVDLNQGKAYLIQPAMGALAMDLSSPAAGVNLGQLYETPVELQGRETIDGLPVAKYRLSARPADNATFNGFVWSTADGIIVKVDGSGSYRGHTSHIAMRLDGIRREAQDPSAFSLPPDLPVLDANPIVRQLLRQAPR